ncbi:hypothetical protein E2C00_29770 [Streptomyces sp. WAC05374]|uniref:hypothetical protein n=1 Tax=Streptomyces sp. WAC05374 TaxID=2487420 RepID=UPI000F865F00|nr:hypothetical protein [Streptomyces sp. WAC05374]RST18258.1 hypothetical protein EF905_06375 [Streptomyces sp. WAC05374]TDF40413.1 hypothetical protein E2B92_24525 [Streptomyces sp. WAC05374]TDF49047.1 hypothetical protein E2C00_29770 [Streptomyces sp. WAC05374]TDF49532.1 hypothetical protein E2C02_26140 [Streptomyces sp. WAC05374]
MMAMRGSLLVVAVATAVVATVGAGGGAAGHVRPTGSVGSAGHVRPAGDLGPAEHVGPEADVAHHGHLSYWDGRLDVVLLSENRGPSALDDTTVRLAFSVPLAAGHDLPDGCVWGGEREVLCSTGPLRVDGTRHETALALRTAGAPQELTARVATAWNGGATDRNPADNDHRVLVLATGDPYVF